jgi:hypothetical protein
MTFRLGEQRMDETGTPLEGSCHCGAVRFRVQLLNGFESARRCNCSYCRMRGAVIVVADAGGVEIVEGQEALASYRFNTRTAEHFFCSRCGIATHLQRRSDPSRPGVNVACLDGVSPFDFRDVPVIDGLHHPGDTGQPARLAGVLRFDPLG